MQIVDNVIILALIVSAFFTGKHISDRYNETLVQRLEYYIRLMSAEKGVGYVAPPVKRRYMPLGQDFIDRVKENGRAIQKFKSSDLEK